MDHEKRSSRTTLIGLVIAGAVIIGLGVVTSKPFQEKFAKSEVASDTASETANPAVAENEAPSADKPAAAADSGSAASEDAAGAPPPDKEAAPEKEAAADADTECCKKGDQTPPLALVGQVPPGGLHNPYDWKELAKDPDLVKQFRLPGCNECHGGTGGGGFCPALSQGVWFWGNTDDVLFRLITQGSAAIQAEGFVRYQYGTVHAPMPPMGHTIKTADHLWHIISFIRSINPPGTNPPEKVIPGKFVPPSGDGDKKAE